MRWSGRPYPQPELIESLLCGLQTTEISFDFLRDYRPPEPVFAAKFRDVVNQNIWNEAQKTVTEFNKIARYIGGIPVRAQNLTPGNTDGTVTSLASYEEGTWVFNLRVGVQNGEEIRGKSVDLREWYLAAEIES